MTSVLSTAVEADSGHPRVPRRTKVIGAWALSLAVVSLVSVGLAGHVVGKTSVPTDVPVVELDGSNLAGPSFDTTGVLDGRGMGPGAADGAIAWAEQDKGNTSYDGWCGRFVANAYGSTSLGFDSAWHAAQAWVPKSQQSNDSRKAPYGALVFFRATTAVPWGHVGISLGNGRMISALQTVQDTDIPSSSYWSKIYYGWAMPPSSWAGRSAPASSASRVTPSNGGLTNPAPATAVPPVVSPSGASPQGAALQGSSPSLQGTLAQPSPGQVISPPQTSSARPVPVPSVSAPVTQAPTAPVATASAPTTYQHTIYHTCANGACGLRFRTGPGYSSYGITRTLVDGNAVNLVCQLQGEPVTGKDGTTSNVWDRTAEGDYVSDYFVDTPGMTGAFSPPIPRC